MKPSRYAIILFSVLLLPVFLASAGDSRQMSIQIKKGLLRSKPSFLGTVMAQTAYGDQVTVLETQGPWKKVMGKTSAHTGWIHESALTPKIIRLKAGAEDAQLAASSDELALAGKGFNEDVEKEFKSRNRNISFAWVDKMEKINVSQSDMRKFVAAGELTPEEGNR